MGPRGEELLVAVAQWGAPKRVYGDPGPIGLTLG